MLSSVSDALDFEKGVSVLDIGCGSGVWIMVKSILIAGLHKLNFFLIGHDQRLPQQYIPWM